MENIISEEEQLNFAITCLAYFYHSIVNIFGPFENYDLFCTIDD